MTTGSGKAGSGPIRSNVELVDEWKSAYARLASRRNIIKRTVENHGGTMPANERQVGGNHYKNKGGEEHWDRAWRLKYDPFQYIITKWVERWRDKGGIEDLKKAQHAIEKYIELVEKENTLRKRALEMGIDLDEGEAGPGYANQ